MAEINPFSLPVLTGVVRYNVRLGYNECRVRCLMRPWLGGGCDTSPFRIPFSDLPLGSKGDRRRGRARPITPLRMIRFPVFLLQK